MLRAEYEEVERGWRPYAPDWHSLCVNEAAGTLKCLAARQDGRLIGYLGYSLDFDMEAYGTLICHQLTWYVEPGHFSVAARMFDWLLWECRRLGVKFLYLSHTERGRGKDMGKFFRRRGAVHTSNIYTLRP